MSNEMPSLTESVDEAASAAVERVVTDAFQTALGWDWPAAPGVPSGAECSAQVAHEVMGLMGMPWLFSERAAQAKVLQTWANNENMSKRTRRDWPTLAKSLDALTAQVVKNHERGD